MEARSRVNALLLRRLALLTICIPAWPAGISLHSIRQIICALSNFLFSATQRLFH